MNIPKDISEYEEAAEHKVVIGNKTFAEKAIEEMAEQRAKCLCCLQFGRCTLNECKKCAAAMDYDECLKSLSSYDKVRLRNLSLDKYKLYSLSPGAWLPFKSYIKYYLLVILSVFFICILVGTGIYLCCEPGRHPEKQLYTPVTEYKQIPDEINNQIISVLDYIYKYPPEDLDEDGQVNCIDYAYYFKQVWDARSVELNTSCICLLAWNQAYLYKGKSAMNHLFIALRAYDTKQQIELEPWVWESWQTRLFLMKDRWSANIYFREYNNYEYYTKMYNRKF